MRTAAIERTVRQDQQDGFRFRTGMSLKQDATNPVHPVHPIKSPPHEPPAPKGRDNIARGNTLGNQPTNPVYPVILSQRAWQSAIRNRYVRNGDLTQRRKDRRGEEKTDNLGVLGALAREHPQSSIRNPKSEMSPSPPSCLSCYPVRRSRPETGLTQSPKDRKGARNPVILASLAPWRENILNPKSKMGTSPIPNLKSAIANPLSRLISHECPCRRPKFRWTFAACLV